MKCPIEPNDRRKAEERNDIMKEQLEAIRAAAKQALSDCADSKLLETLRVQYLGKKGELTGILKQMGKLSAEERPAMGQLANQVRVDIEIALAEKQKKLADAMLAHKLESETLDITLPGKKQKVGSMHPLTIVENEIREIHRLTDQEFAFVAVKDMINIPLIFQLLILEIAIDGLRLAALNTPSMLSTPLSVIAGLVMGEFSVKSGWFNSEVMLYMAFVAVANYTQPNFELGYALKFMRLQLLILTALFNWIGFLIGCIVVVCSICFNKTLSGWSYLHIRLN